MFDAYIRKVIENDALIFPEDFCFKKQVPEDEAKKSLEEIESQLGPYLYAGNYFNNPVSDELVEFRSEWYQKFTFSPELQKKLQNAKCIISIDPATRLKETNDPTGIVVSKIDTDGYVYIIEAKANKYRPNELIEEVFRLNSVYKPDIVSIETVSAQILWIDLLKQEMKRQKTFFRLEEYDPGTKETKASKIRKLIPYYARGQIFHKTNLLELERQLSEFPRNRNDDIIDALQAQIPYWTGTVITSKKTSEKYTEEWWEKLRQGSKQGSGTAEQNLFKEYKKPSSVTVRKPIW